VSHRHFHGERPQIKGLSPEQRTLLAGLPDAPSDGQKVKGSTLRTANALVRRNYARRIGGVIGSEAGFYVRTPTGAKEVASWSK
jgi:hypothetical protein